MWVLGIGKESCLNVVEYLMLVKHKFMLVVVIFACFYWEWDKNLLIFVKFTQGFWR